MKECPYPECPWEKRFERLEGKLDQVIESQNELTAIWPVICRRLDKVEAELWGNGRIGLVSRVYIIATLWALGGAGTFGLVHILTGLLR